MDSNVSRRDSDRSESSEVLHENHVITEATEAFCSSLLREMKLVDDSSSSGVPQDCHTFASFRNAHNNKNAATAATAVEEPNPFAGMPANQALNAKSARAHGRLNQAQIMRRMSSRARPKDRSWF
mmetsp:Transcript_30111/g.72271  ORF Transcript_30111/g.72271 Transcript_30111/m.72271 type:complete len:125 (-) Transcript_30111:341-715(-)